MFDIELLPASEGDALWLRYGDPGAPCHVLVDAGRAATTKVIKDRIMSLPADQRHIELFVITHVDRDHIEGALKLLEDEQLRGVFGEVWFNGYAHLRDQTLEQFGAVQGERLTAALLSANAPWNRAFGGGPVRVQPDGMLPVVQLAGGLELVVLSPDAQKLAQLAPRWARECREAGLDPTVTLPPPPVAGMERFGPRPDVERLASRPLKPDTTAPNGSSIALLARYRQRSVLLGADAHLDRLQASITRLKGQTPRLQLEAFKLPHHGSAGNVSEALLRLIDCRTYLVSTNGNYFGHPTDEAIARVLKWGGAEKTLHFNYTTAFTRIWDDGDLKTRYQYDTHFADASGSGVVDLERAGQ